jgi:phospholipase/lecithinase/hemolysin
MIRRTLIVAAAIWTLSVLPASASTIYSDVFFFGTSELDTGNWLADPTLATDALAPTADKGYWNGRWQEGPAWSDYFAQALGHDAKASLLGGQNYAYGLGWVGLLPGDASPAGYRAIADLYFGTQVSAALTGYAGSLPTDALYVISIGSNDFTFFGRTAAEADDVANAALVEIQRLIDAGATRFLVQTLGGTSPEVITFNATLLTGLAGVNGIDVSILDTRTFNQTVALAPGFLGSLGITDFGTCIADATCLSAAKAAAAAGDPYLGNTHLLFDNIHRNTKLAEALASYAVSRLPQPVPEPGTLALLALGLGAALLSRRNHSAL